MRFKETLSRPLNVVIENFNIYQVVIFLTALSCNKNREKTATRVNERRFTCRTTSTVFLLFFLTKTTMQFYGLQLTSFLSLSLLLCLSFLVSCFTTIFSNRILELFASISRPSLLHVTIFFLLFLLILRNFIFPHVRKINIYLLKLQPTCCYYYFSFKLHNKQQFLNFNHLHQRVFLFYLLK